MEKKIKRILDKKRHIDRLRMYVICRRDLGSPYALVQGAHAVAQYLLACQQFKSKVEWTNGTMIMLAVKDEKDLRKWLIKLDKTDVFYTYFMEPDLNNQATAMAVILEDGSIFKKLELF
jgi:hypothetical protein